MNRLSFTNEIRRNKAKSFLLMSVIFIVIVAIGYVVSLFFPTGYFFTIMVISIIISMAYILISYYNSDKIALMSVNARPATRASHKSLYDSVQHIASNANLPMPKIYVMNSQEINAFATGRNPQNAVICVTTGAMNKLSKEEFEGVLAHELGHVANYDIRFMTITAVMVGLVAILAETFLRSLWFSGGDEKNNNNAVLLIIGILFAILAPIAVQLVQLAISRKREYSADATGVQFSGNSKGLRNALIKIKEEHVLKEELKRYPKAVAPLFISDPFKSKFQNLFSTHPPIDDRIKRLSMM